MKCGCPPARRGFTLLEIMVVLAIMAVAAAMILPRFTATAGPALADEVRRLKQVLRLAAEEAILTSRPLRWTAATGGYRFDRIDDKEEWQPLTEPPFAPHALPQPIRIVAVRQQGIAAAEGASRKAGELARVIFLPDGSVSITDVVLGFAAERLTLLIRPGANGIRAIGDDG